MLPEAVVLFPERWLVQDPIRSFPGLEVEGDLDIYDTLLWKCSKDFFLFAMSSCFLISRVQFSTFSKSLEICPDPGDRMVYRKGFPSKCLELPELDGVSICIDDHNARILT